MGYFIGAQENRGDRFIYVYSGITPENLTNLITQGMESIGYKHLGQGVFEKGSRTKRFWLGAFADYFKVQMAMDVSDPNQIRVSVIRQSTGMSGGLIGMNQADKEMRSLQNRFQSI